MPISSDTINKILKTKKPQYNLYPEFKGYFDISLRMSALVLIIGILLFKAYLSSLIIALSIIVLTGLIYLYINWAFKTHVKLIEINTGLTKSENYELVLTIRRKLDWGLKDSERRFLTFYDNNTAVKGGQIICVFEDKLIYFYCVRISELWPFKRYKDNSNADFAKAVETELVNPQTSCAQRR
ncbi:MAG: hypothetical protein AAGF85_16480 [Bacteroidota bacterium]